MAFPIITGATSSVTADTGLTNTDHTVAMPSGIVAGEKLLMIFGCRPADVNTPAGWSLADNSSATLTDLYVFYKTATLSEPASVTVTTDVGTNSVHRVYRLNNAADPSQILFSLSDVNNNAPNAPSLTPAGGIDDYLWITAFVQRLHYAPDSVPANYSTGNVRFDNSTNGVVMGWGERSLNAASEDPDAWGTIGSQEWSAVTIAISYEENVAPARAITGVDGDDDIYAGQTFTINATGLDPDSDVRTVTLGSETLTIESWSEVSENTYEVSVTLPLFTQLEHGVTHTLTITDDTGALVYAAPVMLSLNPAWESVALAAVPDAGHRSFFHEFVTQQGFTAEVTDVLFLESHADLTVDGEWRPTIDPPSTINGKVRVWDVSAGTFTPPMSYTWTDGGVVAGVDTTPDAFTFIDQTDVDVSTVYESNAITVTGVDVGEDIPVSITGGEYAVSTDGGSTWGAFTSTPTNVQLNYQIKVRTTSSASYETGVNVGLTVGGISDTFTLTTMADPVVPDTTPPVITLIGSPTVEVDQGTAYTEQGATATDDRDGDITEDIVISGDIVDTNTVGSYNVTYDVMDASGNPATTVTRTITVVDNTKPVITLLGNVTTYIAVNGTYSEPGAVAVDNNDGVITGSISIGGDTVDETTVGTYTLTYDVTDAAGNTAVTVTRDVVIYEPTVVTGSVKDLSFGLTVNMSL